MTNNNDERDARRVIILDGLNKGLSKEKIAEKLGIHPRMVRRDLNRMYHKKDPELKQALTNAKENALAEKERIANRTGEKFLRETGMTFQDKTFNNMMTFYKPEIRSIMKSNNKDVAIKALPSGVARTLRRNGIIGRGHKSPLITKKAQDYLAKQQFAQNIGDKKW